MIILANIQDFAQKNPPRIAFIHAAQSLIDTERPENLSVRNIAKKAGFHNSTIYLYFDGLDHLICLSTMKYMSEYNEALAKLGLEHKPPADVFFETWHYFCKNIFQRPFVFRYFFFGKYAGQLSRIMREYYDLFPEEEKIHTSNDIREMYYADNLEARSSRIMYPLIGTEGYRVTEDNLHLCNTIIVTYFETLLKRKCDDPDLDNEMLYEELARVMTLIVKKI